MVVDMTRIAQLEREPEEVRTQLWKEEAECLHILMREIKEEEKERIMESLTDKQERILFGLEQPEVASRISAARLGTSGGEMVCSVCGKRGLTKRGLGLHMVRIHKDQKMEETEL